MKHAFLFFIFFHLPINVVMAQSIPNDCLNAFKVKKSCEKLLTITQDEIIHLPGLINRCQHLEIPQQEKIVAEAHSRLIQLDKSISFYSEQLDHYALYLGLLIQSKNLLNLVRPLLAESIPEMIQNIRSYFLEQTIILESLIAEKEAEWEKEENEKKKGHLRLEIKILQEVSLFTQYAREKYGPIDLPTLERIIQHYFNGHENESELLNKEITPLTLQVILMAIKLHHLRQSGQILYDQIMENFTKHLVKLEADKKKMESNLEIFLLQRESEKKNLEREKLALKKLHQKCNRLSLSKEFKENHELRIVKHWDQRAMKIIKELHSGACESHLQSYTETPSDGKLCHETYFDPGDFFMCVQDPPSCE